MSLNEGDRPDPEPTHAPPPPALGRYVACLILGGVFYAVLAVVLGPLVGGVTWLFEGKGTPADMQAAGVVQTVMLYVCGSFSAVSLVGAWGMHRRTKYGWILTLVMAVVYTASICFPVGLVLLLGALKTDVRKACGF